MGTAQQHDRSVWITAGLAFLAVLLIVGVFAGSASAKPAVSISASVGSDGQSVIVTLNGTIDPGSTCSVSLAGADSSTQSQDCTAWPGGSPSSYTFAASPGQSYTASYAIYNPAGGSAAGVTSVQVPTPTDATPTIPAPVLIPANPVYPTVSLDVEQITATSAVLVLDGNTEPGSTCSIAVTIGQTAQIAQQLDCTGWTGGEKDIQLRGLSPANAYLATVTVTNPEGGQRSTGTGFTTRPRQAEGCPAGQRLIAGKCQPKPPRDRKVSLIVACSTHRLPHRDRSCRAGSHPVFRVRANEPTKIKLCVYPTHFGYGPVGRAMRCSRAIHLQENRPITGQLWHLIRNRPTLARIRSVYVVLPYKGNAIKARQQLRFYASR